MTKFGKTLKAVERQDKDGWAIADAVLADVPWSGAKSNDGSGAMIEELSAELALAGFHYSKSALRQYRSTAHYFEHDTRMSCSFSVHRAARTPEVLEIAVSRAAGYPVTVDAVKKIRKELHPPKEKIDGRDSNQIAFSLRSRNPKKVAAQIMDAMPVISVKEWAQIIAEMDNLQIVRAEQQAALQQVASDIAGSFQGE